MYSVVEIGGSQYKVAPGDIIDVQKLDVEVGSDYNLEKVLFIGGDAPKVGTPTVAKAKVTAKVIRNARSPKLLVYKKFDKKWRRSKGHRQSYTALLVTSIDNGSGDVAKIDNKSKNAEKHLK